MTEQLKPCPFCGGRASMAKSHDPDTHGAFHFIQCHKCRAMSGEFYAVETCPIFYGQVRDAWNARAAIAALTPTPQEVWQPIETAPKDGTRILLWLDPQSIVVPAEWRGRWMGDDYPLNMTTPTHWMPQPPPPAISEDSHE
ncbi:MULTISPECIES: Lar family restriction alleviation protein [unclassified Sulfitobacter]|uniref:Lar family restriction alleviation protein n=1 Tax=unclassified Sulfitobacter TaxID=196795 RepID=UPI0037456533